MLAFSGGTCPHEDSGNMSSVALYEPDSLMRSLLAEWLTQARYRVHVPDGVPSHRRDVDLVIVSLHSLRVEGLEVIRAVRLRHPDAPLIALSGHFRRGLPANGAAARALEVTQVLVKPVTRHELLAGVKAVIGLPCGRPSGEQRDGLI
jgi:DNA-binding response OmpR family regulator